MYTKFSYIKNPKNIRRTRQKPKGKTQENQETPPPLSFSLLPTWDASARQPTPVSPWPSSPHRPTSPTFFLHIYKYIQQSVRPGRSPAMLISGASHSIVVVFLPTSPLLVIPLQSTTRKHSHDPNHVLHSLSKFTFNLALICQIE